MLLVVLLFLAASIVTSTIVTVLPRTAAARIWVGLPLGLVAMVIAAYLVVMVIIGTPSLLPWLLAIGIAGTAATRLAVRSWSWLGSQLFAMAALGALAYIAYSIVLTFGEGLGPVGIVASLLLLVLEMSALALSLSYAFEIVDVLTRRTPPLPPPDPGYRPRVALQVPTYNEPVQVVQQTLQTLARVDYDNLIVQVVDNNTPDPATWRPLEELCQKLGPRFQFMHLENWPGYKAGALNEATRRLPPDVEILGIVDADYRVASGFLRATVGYFADPDVAFVQTPQDYRNWEDDDYLRALFYSYAYFFVITMPARAHRNAIIFAGTMGLIRRQALEAIGGWNIDVVTEDAEASLRLLGRGLHGVYVPRPWGRGMMPLNFDGLKKQRFRWALGGIQILRRHWRELVPFADHRLHLTTAQRIHYLLGSVQWFGDLLNACFTFVLVATALATALHAQLPLRVIAGAAIVVPLANLITGVGRALWAMKVATNCTWRDAFGALREWFALSWTVALACLSGLAGGRKAFLRTPKVREGTHPVLAAIRSSATETAIAAVATGAALVMFIRAPNFATGALAVLLLFQAFIYSNAIWAGAGAEGITLTPERRAYLSSPQTTGDWPAPRHGSRLPAIVGAGALALLAWLVLAAPRQTATTPPAIARAPGGGVIGRSATPTPAATPARTPGPATTPRTNR